MGSRHSVQRTTAITLFLVSLRITSSNRSWAFLSSVHAQHTHDTGRISLEFSPHTHKMLWAHWIVQKSHGDALYGKWLEKHDLKQTSLSNFLKMLMCSVRMLERQKLSDGVSTHLWWGRWRGAQRPESPKKTESSSSLFDGLSLIWHLFLIHLNFKLKKGNIYESITQRLPCKNILAHKSSSSY